MAARNVSTYHKKLFGKRLGILGLVRIAQAIATHAAECGMEVGYRFRQTVVFLYEYEPSAVHLTQWCDFQIVARAGGTPARHLLSTDVLTALGPIGFLINISRDLSSINRRLSVPWLRNA
jgi:lactate dehydrogenase-like 2-hydroxyacid dehydrogenase